MKRSFAVLLACSAACVVAGCTGSDSTSIEIGDPAPAFSLPAADPVAGKISSDQLRGKIAVLNFWSTTCAVCLKETEDLGRIHDKGKAVVIGVALEKDADHLGRIVRQRGIRYPVALGDEETFSRYDGYAVPYTIVLDRTQAVRRKVYGRIGEEELTKLIDEIDRTSVALGPAESPR